MIQLCIRTVSICPHNNRRVYAALLVRFTSHAVCVYWQTEATGHMTPNLSYWIQSIRVDFRYIGITELEVRPPRTDAVNAYYFFGGSQ